MSTKRQVAVTSLPPKIPLEVLLKEGRVATLGGGGYSGENPDFGQPGRVITEFGNSHFAIYMSKAVFSCNKAGTGFLRPYKDGGLGISEADSAAFGFGANSSVHFDNLLIRPRAGKLSFMVSDILVDTPKWEAGKFVILGEKRQNAGKVYVCTATGVTGVDAPVHSANSVSDGSVSWHYENEVGSLKDFNAGVAASGYLLTDDFDYNAEMVILVLGDSIAEAGGNSKLDTIYWQVRQYYRAKGIRVRVVNMAYSGTSSRQGKLMMEMGRFDIDNVVLVLWNHGANDAAQNFTAEEHVSNLAAHVDYFPNAKFLVQGITPIRSDAMHANAELYRAGAKAYADTKGNAFYVETKNAYDRTSPEGDGLHPPTAGYHAIWNTAIKPFLDANIPTI